MAIENYGTLLPTTGDTKRILEGKILRTIAAGGGGGGGGAIQVFAYTGTDPNSDGIVPTNTQIINLAAKPGASTWTWSVAAQNWQ